MTDADLEKAARASGWKPTVLGEPAPSPLLVLGWMRWAYDLGRRNVADELFRSEFMKIINKSRAL